MFRKDFTHNLWVVWLPLLVTAAAGAIKLFKISMVNFGPNDLVSGFFMFNFLFVLPIMAFLSGIVLFQQEEWHLVWGMPGSRMKVMVQKTLAGFFLVVFSIVVSFTIFSLLMDVSVTQAEIAGFWLPVSVLFLLGTLSGIATRSILSGIMLIAVSGFAAFLFVWFTGLWTKMVLSIAWVGPVIIGLYLVIMILLLKISITFLFYWSREYRPFRRFITAFFLLSVSIILIFGANVFFLNEMTSIKKLSDYKVNWITPVNSETALITGGSINPVWLRDIADWFDVGFGGWEISVIYNFKSGEVVQLNKYQMLRYVIPSRDGKYIANISRNILYDWGFETKIRVVDLDGNVHFSHVLDVNEENSFRYSHLFFSSEGSELNILLGGKLTTVEMESGAKQERNIPSRKGLYRIHGSYAFHSCLYVGDHLIYFRSYGDDGFQVFQYEEQGDHWLLIHEEGAPEDVIYEDRGRGFYYVPKLYIKYRDKFIALKGTENEVKFYTVPRKGLSWFIPTDRGILKNRDFRLTLTDWESGEMLYDIEVPFTDGIGFAFKDTAFLAAGRNELNPGETLDLTFQFVDISTGEVIKEIEGPAGSENQFREFYPFRGAEGFLLISKWRMRAACYNIDIDTFSVEKTWESKL